MQALTAEQYARLQRLAERYRERHAQAFKQDPRRNPHLTVDLLCFQPVGGPDEDALCGVLLTPLALSLALAPGASDARPSPGERRLVDLPGGRYPFVAEPLGDDDWMWRCELLDDLTDLGSHEEATRLAQHLSARVMTAPAVPDNDA